jgi:hypothetical protein
MPESDPGIERREDAQAAPVGRRRFKSTRFACLPGGGLHRLDRELTKPGPLDLRPALELVGARDLKTVQERAGIELDRALDVATRFRVEEFGEIALELPWVDQELRGFRPDQLTSELAPEAIEGLGEGVASLGLGGIGPEEQEQAIPADPVLPGCYDRRQEAEPPRTGPRDPLAIPLQPQPAKGP